MLIDSNLSRGAHAFNGIGLSARFRSLIDKKAPRYHSRDATIDEIEEYRQRAERLIPTLAGRDALAPLRDKNPSIFQVVIETASDRVVGFNAQLPLSDKGLEALLSGDFSSAAPHPDFVVEPGQKVEAIYAWLVFSPSSYVASIAGFGLVQQQFFPSSTRLELMVDLKLPEGSSLEATRAQAQKLE